jgi:hypothetical protein
MAVVSQSPALYRLTDGRLEVRCGRCVAAHEAVAAPDAEAAWALLRERGWTHYLPARMQSGYAQCPSCSLEPHDIDGDARAAMRGRRKK